MTQVRAESRARAASVRDTVLVGLTIGLPLVARGLIARRRGVVGLLDRVDSDRRMVELAQRLRDRYDGGPLLLRLPGRDVLMPLSGEDVARVLDSTPVPFTPASREKVGALEHFQPHGLLISEGTARQSRRRFTERALDTPHALHRLAHPLAAVLHQEAAGIAAAVGHGELRWPDLAAGWWRAVRRMVLGDSARDDTTLTDQLMRLRLHANWSALHPRRDQLRRDFDQRLRTHIARAEPGSIAGVLAGINSVDPAGQVPHWLFAFDAAGITVMRTLALLAAHPEHVERTRDEPEHRPYLRACLLEALRLWPTTPAILRETTTETSWGDTTLPTGTTVLILAPYFHRDDRSLDYANRFTPDIWLDGRAQANPALVPFSGGPAGCPGQNLTLFATSTLVAALLSALDIRPRVPILDTDRLPGVLDHFRTRLAVAPR